LGHVGIDGWSAGSKRPPALRAFYPLGNMQNGGEGEVT
jgi:hypothetical protein